MAYQVLSRKWRPRTFQEVVGQEPITRSLQQGIKRGRLGHAYLLTGTRGIGKTSVARILAMALRCESLKDEGNPCSNCRGCMEVSQGSSVNVIEIDGASNNSVDNIRDLISQVKTLPSFGSTKVYIIDEVHMLSISAFNALLKTLEEPPEHLVFILATTDPERIPSTVLSRCQRFDFRNASVETLVKHVKKIAKKEEIQFETDKLIESLCVQAKGSFRDTLSLLDQVLCFSDGKKISEEMLSMALGFAQSSSIKKILEGIINGDLQVIRHTYQSILYENVSLENLCRDLLNYFYEMILKENMMKKSFDFKVEISQQEAFWIYETLAKDFEWALKSLAPDKVVEVVLHKVALRRTFFKKEEQIETKAIKITKTTKEKKREEKAEDFKEQFQAPPPERQTETKSWLGFMEYLSKLSPVMASNLEQGNLLNEIDFHSDHIHLEIGFRNTGQIFYDYLCDSKVKDKLKSYFSEYSKQSINTLEIKFSLIENEKEDISKNFQTQYEIELEQEKVLKKEKEEKILNNPVIQKAKEIFKTRVDKIKLNS